MFLKSSLVVGAAMAIVPGIVPAFFAPQTPASSELDKVVIRLETAVLADDVAGLKDARIALLRLVAGKSETARLGLLRYTIGYAAWRLAFSPNVPAGEKNDLLDDAEVQLKEVEKLMPDFAEAPGLLSAVYGAKIAQAPDLGMTLGMQASALMSRALSMDPANPRLLVLRGTSLYHTPPEYGGSVKEAEASFRRALARFDQVSAGAPWPNWGRFDAHVWLGQALAARGDKAGARAEYEKALAIAPASNWVKFGLLPKVK
jgi:tetratricopeptide (TPR) repeat protein